MLTEDDIKNALKAVKYPGYSRDIVSFGLVKQVAVKDGAVSVTLSLTSANPEAARQLKTEGEQVLKSLPGVKSVYVEVTAARSAGCCRWGESLVTANQGAGDHSDCGGGEWQGRGWQIDGIG